MRITIWKTIGVCLVVLLTACSNRAWYEGTQGSARAECAKDREPCPEAPDYDRYKQERDELKKPN